VLAVHPPLGKTSYAPLIDGFEVNVLKLDEATVVGQAKIRQANVLPA